MKEVKYFSDEYSYELERKINEFAKTHKIISISYSITKAWHHCMVLYEV